MRATPRVTYGGNIGRGALIGGGDDEQVVRDVQTKSLEA